MKNIKRWLCLGLMICAVGTLSGCSFQETWSLLTGKSQKTEEGTVEEMDPSEIMTKDDSVAVPEFSANLEGSVNYLIHEEAAPLTAVSYTHLDVYKRQLLYCGNWFARVYK